MTYLDVCRDQLRIDEGLSPKPYTDTAGKISIGVGRNLTDVGLSDDEIGYLFMNDLGAADARARAAVPSFDDLSAPRKAVLVQMAFNLGGGLRAFTRMLAAVAGERWDEAAAHMLDSEWRREVGARAERLAQAMREG